MLMCGIGHGHPFNGYLRRLQWHHCPLIDTITGAPRSRGKGNSILSSSWAPSIAVVLLAATRHTFYIKVALSSTTTQEELRRRKGRQTGFPRDCKTVLTRTVQIWTVTSSGLPSGSRWYIPMCAYTVRYVAALHQKCTSGAVLTYRIPPTQVYNVMWTQP